ncbi:transposase, partial [Roseateles sp. GG27B]
LAVDALTGMLMALTLTENDVGDPSQVAPLLDQVDAEIGSVTADGAYDGMSTYDAVAVHGENIAVDIPPPVTSVLSDDAALNPSQRDRHIAMIQAQGRLGWQKESGYGRRSLVETTMVRFEAIIGPRLRARSLGGPAHRSRRRRGRAQPHLEHRTAQLRPPHGQRFLRSTDKGILRPAHDPCNNACCAAS